MKTKKTLAILAAVMTLGIGPVYASKPVDPPGQVQIPEGYGEGEKENWRHQIDLEKKVDNLEERVEHMKSGSGSSYDDTDVKNAIEANKKEIDGIKQSTQEQFDNVNRDIGELKDNVKDNADTIGALTESIDTRISGAESDAKKALDESNKANSRLDNLDIPDAYDDTELKGKIEETKKEVDNLKQSTEDQFDNVNRDLGELKSGVNDNKKAIEDLNKKIDNTQPYDDTDLRNKVNQNTQNIKANAAEVDRLHKVTNNLASDIALNKGIANEANVRSLANSKDIKDIKEVDKAQNARLDHIDGNIKTLQGDVGEIKGTLAEHESAIEGLNQSVEQNTKDILKNKNEIDGLHRMDSNLQGQIDTNRDNITKLTEEVKDGQAAQDKLIQNNAEGILNNSQRIDENKQSINKNTEEINKNKQDIKKNAENIKNNSQRIAELQNTMEGMSNRIDSLDKRMDNVGASVAALAALKPLDFDADHKATLAFGTGHYKGSNAMAAGIYYMPDENTLLGIGMSIGKEKIMNTSVSFRL